MEQILPPQPRPVFVVPRRYLMGFAGWSDSGVSRLEIVYFWIFLDPTWTILFCDGLFLFRPLSAGIMITRHMQLADVEDERGPASRKRNMTSLSPGFTLSDILDENGIGKTKKSHQEDVERRVYVFTALKSDRILDDRQNRQSWYIACTMKFLAR